MNILPVIGLKRNILWFRNIALDYSLNIGQIQRPSYANVCGLAGASQITGRYRKMSLYFDIRCIMFLAK